MVGIVTKGKFVCFPKLQKTMLNHRHKVTIITRGIASIFQGVGGGEVLCVTPRVLMWSTADADQWGKIK